MHRVFRFLQKHFFNAEISDISRWTILAAGVGVIVAIVCIAFNLMLETVQYLTLEKVAGFSPPLPYGEGDHFWVSPNVKLWALALLPALGGLLCGVLLKLAPETAGGGIDHTISTFHHRRGLIRNRVPWVKILVSSLTIGTGGSAGREGPAGQAGAGVGASFAALLKLRDRDRRVLVLCGMAAGIGAIFKCPLGGALFATEILYRDPEFEFEALIPCFVSSIVAYSFYCPVAGVGWGSLFVVPELFFTDPTQLLLYALLAVAMVGLGVIFVRTYGWIERGFQAMRVPFWVKPGIGGLLVGLLSVAFTFVVQALEGVGISHDFTGGILGMGYGYVQWAIDNKAGFGIVIMLLMALMKMVATSLTLGSGGSGGAFAPSLVVGGLGGGALGHVFHMYFPVLVPQEQIPAFILVGMAGFFTSVSKTPLAAIFMVVEMTFGYGLLVPLMLVVALSYILTPRASSLYATQLDGRVSSPAHTGDFIVDVLEGLRVRDVLSKKPFLTIREEMLLPRILTSVLESRQNTFPVVTKENRLVGVILLNDIRAAFLNHDLTLGLIIARDLAVVSYEPIVSDESLNTALRKFISASIDELPVVSDQDRDLVIGLLTRHDLMVAYNRQMQERLKLKVLKE